MSFLRRVTMPLLCELWFEGIGDSHTLPAMRDLLRHTSRNLTDLRFDHCAAATDSIMSQATKCHMRLQSLCVRGSLALTRRGVRCVCRRLQRLTALDLSACRCVGDATLKMLSRSLPALQVCFVWLPLLPSVLLVLLQLLLGHLSVLLFGAEMQMMEPCQKL